jgi:hypothetical protein
MLDTRNSSDVIGGFLQSESELLPPFFCSLKWAKISHKRLLSSKIRGNKLVWDFVADWLP